MMTCTFFLSGECNGLDCYQAYFPDDPEENCPMHEDIRWRAQGLPEPEEFGE